MSKKNMKRLKGVVGTVVQATVGTVIGLATIGVASRIAEKTPTEIDDKIVDVLTFD